MLETLPNSIYKVAIDFLQINLFEIFSHLYKKDKKCFLYALINNFPSKQCQVLMQIFCIRTKLKIVL